MDNISKIRQYLRTIAGADRPAADFLRMEVISVDGDTCTARLGEFEMPDVRLSPIADGSAKGLLVTPAAGSIILVADASQGAMRDLVAVGYTDVEKVEFKTTGGVSVKVSGDGIEINGGDNGGLVVSAKTAERLNAIERDLNTLKTVFKTWVTTPQDGGAALKTAAATWAGQQLSTTKAGDLENKKVKH